MTKNWQSACIDLDNLQMRKDKDEEAVLEKPVSTRPALTPLSEEARAARKPLPVEVLAGAMQDTVHVEGVARVVSTRPLIVGVDKGKPEGDFTGYACSCGQIRVSPDGPCERVDCPIRTAQSATQERSK